MTSALVGYVPAGFWRRALAWSLDWLVLGVLLAWLFVPMLVHAWSALLEMHTVLQDWLLERLLSASSLPSPMALVQAALADGGLRASIEGAVSQVLLGLAKAALGSLAAAALYFTCFEASAWQATPGKRLLGIQVASLAGLRIGLGRSAARFLAGSVSWLTFNLGHAMAGWRVDGRALHDLLAATRVERRPELAG